MHDQAGMFYLYTGLTPPPAQITAMQQPISICPLWAASCHSMISALTDVMSWKGSQADFAACTSLNADALVCGSPALRQ
eukprot:8825264-Heterocapsa_arctica.AAC.1